MTFRDFVLREEAGLGDLGSGMDRAFNNPYYTRFAGAYLSTDMSGTEQPETLGSAGHPLYLPSTDLVVPQVERTGRIKVLDYGRNPIYLELTDGTRAFFTHDEFRRIRGRPAVGKLMSIVFQRHGADHTDAHSKIERATVLDG
jgi:hypothetical protein